MATLTTAQLRMLQQRAALVVLRAEGIHFDKGEVNLAVQAMEDWFEANKASGAAAVEAVVPGVFTNAEKLVLFAVWMTQRAVRDGGA